MAAPTVSGSVNLNESFSETITAGVITPQNLPASMSQNLNYSYASTGASLTTDTLWAKAAQFGGGGAGAGGTVAHYCTIPLTSLSDLAGNAITFQRVRELVIQNSLSYPIYLYGGNSSGGSAVPWLPGTASGSSALQIPGYGSASANSVYWPTFRICDPVTSAVSSGAQLGYFVSTATPYFTLYNGAGASTDSVNIMIAGCATY